MSTIRYDFLGDCERKKTSDGDYVHYDDYLKLEKAAHVLAGALTVLKLRNKKCEHGCEEYEIIANEALEENKKAKEE